MLEILWLPKTPRPPEKSKPGRAIVPLQFARVTDHKIATIIESRKTAKRDYRICHCSLNNTCEDANGWTIDQDDYFLRIGKLSCPAEDLLDLKIDVCRAIEKLPTQLQELCMRLVSQTVTEISRDTGIPRATIYDRKKEIAAIFEDAGLRDYL